jgi:hypothetical protein
MARTSPVAGAYPVIRALDVVGALAIEQNAAREDIAAG